MTSDPGDAPVTNESDTGTTAQPTAAPKTRARGIPFKFLIPAVIALDVLAVMLVPPFPEGGQPGQACGFPSCYIQSAIEFPPPAIVFDLSPSTAPASAPMVYFHPSISSTILTMWIVMALILVLAIAATRGLKLIPGRLQNAVEWAYEFGSDFAVGIGGEKARGYYPIFAAFFIFILFSNWSGLVPPIGKIEQLRAPTSDVNVTIGLALTSFVLFQGEGFRRLGMRGYLGKFFPLGEFRHGIGAGLLAMYVGIIELFLEFVKPVTLSMRLFGNIYGGEVALAVITALTIAIIPVTLVGLEALLNLIQALIFSVLTLMFILIAIEGHGTEEHHPAQAGGTGGHQPASEGADQTQPVAA
ncbi:MAG: F0F1 ATP synthase subunit A [Candidatus Limnocylindrales bacterium]